MASKNSARNIFLKGTIRVLAGVGGLSFLFGGVLIHALTKTDRTLAELEGIGVAGVCLILAIASQHLVDDMPEAEDDIALNSESTHK